MKTDAHWQKIGLKPHHGICIPLFALHSATSCGIGEFLDLLPLIDWCKEIGLDTIQLLPLNDTGTDPSPYNPISSSALDPVYLSLSELGISPLPPLAVKQRIEVLSFKLPLLRKFFEETFSALSQTSAYQSFLAEHAWLPLYARFKALKEQYSDKHWSDWPPDATPSPKDIDFYTFLQFHAFRQMALVRSHAQKQRIFLKGDIPILINSDSVDVWSNPTLFRLDLHAGAPPDAYNALGQDWGSPLFDLEAMSKDGFLWWKQRMKVIAKLYDIYRIDHVVGFFRIWGIAKGKLAKEGLFFPSDPALWDALGKKMLELLIDTSPLLPMAEDLGTIPKSVYPILKELGICSTKVVRWERRDNTYIPFDQYEPFSLTTLSTHDTDTLSAWWQKTPEESVPFAQFLNIPYHPILSAPNRLKILRAVHHTPSYFHINLLQEYLALFPDLVWPNPDDQRINIPGTVLPTNWSYRFRPSLETIISHEGLKKAFREILI